MSFKHIIIDRFRGKLPILVWFMVGNYAVYSLLIRWGAADPVQIRSVIIPIWLAVLVAGLLSAALNLSPFSEGTKSVYMSAPFVVVGAVLSYPPTEHNLSAAAFVIAVVLAAVMAATLYFAGTLRQLRTSIAESEALERDTRLRLLASIEKECYFFLDKAFYTGIYGAVCFAAAVGVLWALAYEQFDVSTKNSVTVVLAITLCVCCCHS